jgi:glycosyltransferase involved in cell wall biosynthesis
MADEGQSPAALIIVRNPCTHDSRVLREAATLSRLGYRPSIVAVTSDAVTARHDSADGTPVLRLAPTSPLAWISSRLRTRRDVSAEKAPGRTAARIESPARNRPARGLRAFVVRVHRWLRTLDFYRRAIREVRIVQPGLLHCNDYNTMWVGVAARMMGGTAVIYDSHELWPDRNLRPEPRWWLIACEWLFVRSAHRTLTTSPGYAEVIARRYRVARPTLVRNIPAPDAVNRPDPNGGINGDASLSSRHEATVTYVGALTRNRGLEVAIAAIARVPDARLRLVGPVDDAYRDELVELADRDGVLDRVELAGSVPPTEVVRALRGSTVGVALIQPTCLSYELSLPNKLFEYVLAGIPVLGSEVGVIGAFIREQGVGLTVPPDDVEQVAQRMKEMLQPQRNSELRRRVATAASGLSWERESRLLAHNYTDAAARLR